MATEVLLNVLDDTLKELRAEYDKINSKLSSDHAFWVGNAHQCLRSDEDTEARARLKLKKIDDQLAALVMHVNGLSEQPKALQDKISRLSGDRIEARKEHQAAANKIPQARKNLETAKLNMELEENRLKDIEKQIQEVQNQLIGPDVAMSS
jgi:DNA repair exonuclease SbcCD ATPase subunit